MKPYKMTQPPFGGVNNNTFTYKNEWYYHSRIILESSTIELNAFATLLEPRTTRDSIGPSHRADTPLPVVVRHHWAPHVLPAILQNILYDVSFVQFKVVFNNIIL